MSQFGQLFFLVIEFVNMKEQGWSKYFSDDNNYVDLAQILCHTAYFILKLIDHTQLQKAGSD